MPNYNFIGYNVISDTPLIELDSKIMQSVLVLLSTPRGSVPLRPDMGSRLKELLFEPINANYLGTLAKEFVVEALNYERRIRVKDVYYLPYPDRNAVMLGISFVIIRSNASLNFVYEINDAPTSGKEVSFDTE